MKKLLTLLFTVLFFTQCSNDEIEFIPISPVDFGSENTIEYTIENTLKLYSETLLPINFNKEDVTELSYIKYYEKQCSFVFDKDQTSKYKIEWDWECEKSLRIEYSQNGYWKTIPMSYQESRKGSYVLEANRGMMVRVVVPNSGYKGSFKISINAFSIKDMQNDK